MDYKFYFIPHEVMNIMKVGHLKRPLKIPDFLWVYAQAYNKHIFHCGNRLSVWKRH